MNKVLYLRTDIYNQKLIAGGSVAHTLGVIKGLVKNGNKVVCASSIMPELIKDLDLEEFLNLKNPIVLSFLRWKLNCIFFNFFFQ